MALSYLEEMDLIQPVWRCVCVLIADDCWVFNRCLLLFKHTVIPSVFMAFMQCEWHKVIENIALADAMINIKINWTAKETQS